MSVRTTRPPGRYARRDARWDDQTPPPTAPLARRRPVDRAPGLLDRHDIDAAGDTGRFRPGFLRAERPRLRVAWSQRPAPDRAAIVRPGDARLHDRGPARRPALPGQAAV